MVALESDSCKGFKKHESKEVLLLDVGILFDPSINEHKIDVLDLQILVINQARALAERGKTDLGHLWPSCFRSRLQIARLKKLKVFVKNLRNQALLLDVFD